MLGEPSTDPAEEPYVEPHELPERAPVDYAALAELPDAEDLFDADNDLPPDSH